MNQTKVTKKNTDVVDPDKKAKKPWQAYLSGSPTLFFSLIVHLVFAALAAYFIVQRIEIRRKPNFSEVSVKSSSAAAAQAQHQVEMTKKKYAMTTPDITQRIVTTGFSPITLPEIAMPSDSSATSASKMGAAEVSGLGVNSGPGMGMGSTLASPAVQIDTVALAASAFGVTNGSGLGLVGHFYDLKQTRNRQATGIENRTYYSTISAFLDAGWPEGYFKNYFMANQVLYLPQLFIPHMLSEAAPKAFGVEKEVQPGLWIALYKGKFQVPITGTYRLVGCGDNLMKISVNGKLVMNQDYRTQVQNNPADIYIYTVNNRLTPKFTASDWMSLTEGQANGIQILIGDDGGDCGFWLMVEEKGYPYHKTPEGYPILPLFKVSTVHLPPADTNCPPYDNRYLGWTMAGDEANAGSTESIPDKTPTN